MFAKFRNDWTVMHFCVHVVHLNSVSIMCHQNMTVDQDSQDISVPNTSFSQGDPSVFAILTTWMLSIETTTACELRGK